MSTLTKSLHNTQVYFFKPRLISIQFSYI